MKAILILMCLLIASSGLAGSSTHSTDGRANLEAFAPWNLLGSPQWVELGYQPPKPFNWCVAKGIPEINGHSKDPFPLPEYMPEGLELLEGVEAVLLT